MACGHVFDFVISEQIKVNHNPVYCMCTNIVKETYDTKYELVDFSNNKFIVGKKDLERNMLILNIDVINLYIDGRHSIQKFKVINVNSFDEINNIIKSYKEKRGLDKEYQGRYVVGNPNIGYFKYQYGSFIDYNGMCNEITIPSETDDIFSGALSFNRYIDTLNINNCKITRLDLMQGINTNIHNLNLHFTFERFNKISIKPFGYDYKCYSGTGISIHTLKTAGYFIPLESADLHITLNGNDISADELAELSNNRDKIDNNYEKKWSQYFDVKELPKIESKLSSFNMKSTVIGSPYDFDITCDQDKQFYTLSGIKCSEDKYSNADKTLKTIQEAGNILTIPPVNYIMNTIYKPKQYYCNDNLQQELDDRLKEIENYKFDKLKLPNTLSKRIIETICLPHCYITVDTDNRYRRGRSGQYIHYTEPLFREIYLPDNITGVIFDSHMDYVILHHRDINAPISKAKYMDFSGIPVKIISIRNLIKNNYTTDAYKTNRIYKYSRAITLETKPGDRRTVDADKFLKAVLQGQIYPSNAEVYFNGDIRKI